MKRFMAITLAAGSILLSGTALLAWDNERVGHWHGQAYATPDVRYGADDTDYDVKGVEDRLQRQEERINVGIELGDLTGREEHFLRGQLARIEATERYFLGDGRLDQAELARLHAMLDRNSTFIYRARHNEWNRRGHASLGYGNRFDY